MAELAIMAARKVGRLPIEITTIDEEIYPPGTPEYMEWFARRPEVSPIWIVNNQPNNNLFSRETPFWYNFDRQVESKWVRRYPDFAVYIGDPSMGNTLSSEYFDLKGHKRFVSLIGLRAEESLKRRRAIASVSKNEGAWETKVASDGFSRAYPIYDWTDDDVWKFIKDFKLRYSDAYNKMYAAGIPKKQLRIGPILHNSSSLRVLGTYSRIWPHWFDRVAERLPGIRLLAKFGRAAVTPQRKLRETWEQAYHRINIDEAPQWIRERSLLAKEKVLQRHSGHSTAPFPEVMNCDRCGKNASWKGMTHAMYFGDRNCDETAVSEYFTWDLYNFKGEQWWRDNVSVEQYFTRTNKNTKF
jgi:predicted phosphoadenosine phosphosulfate sulfurtransferase